MEVVVTTMVKLLANAQLSFDHRADSVAASFPVPLLSHAWSNLHSLTELVKEAQEAGSLNVVDQLETGPTYTLGRLLLQGRLPPDRLEEAAHNLGLDLMTIIVQSCCPLVPTGGVASIEGAVDDAEVIVLNEGEFPSTSRSPTLIVEEILTQLIHLVKDYISLDGATISLHSCQKIAASAGFAIIVVATSELASVDLDLLASDEEKLCFWVNVFNLMFVHTMLWAAVHNKCLPLLDETSVAAMLYLQTIRYTVGQINLVSLFDVRYFILRRGLPAPHGGLLAHRLHPLQESDPWWKHTAPSVDARVQFVLLTGSLFHSPPLQVIRQVLLEEQLKLATRQFLEHRICIDAARKQVFVPPSLHLFAADMAPAASMDATPDATVTGDRWHATQLLHFMGLYCPDLQQLLNKGKKSDGRLRVSALSVTPEPGLTLAYPPSSGATSPRGHRRITSLPIRMGGAVSLGDEPAAGARIPPVFKAPPTEAALAFTSEKSRLLGTVLRLFARAAGNDVPDVASEFPRLSAFLEAAVWPVLDVVTPRHRQDVLAVLLSRSAQSNAVRFLVKAMSPAISDGRGEAVLHAISCLPHTTQRSHQLRLISDHLLCGAIWEQTRLRTAAAERGEDASAWSPWQWLTAVYDGDAKRRCALGCMEHWPVEACVCALQTCCDDPPRSATLHEAITQKLGEMKVYQKVMECAVLCHGNARPVQGECTTELATYEYWIFTASMSRSQPTVILNILLKCHEYSVAREWASMHDATHELRQRIEEAHITYLLDSQNDLFKAYKVLADIENKRLCLGACLLLMEQLSSLTHVMSVCQFVLCCLGDELTDTERTKLQRIKLGIKALLLLPEQLCEEYQELISRPDLLIEQLLMNFKVEYVASVYKEIQGAAPDSSLTSLGCGQEWFNTLVLHYAFKALEFPFRGSPQSVTRSPEHTKFSGEGMSGGRTAGVMRQSLSAESLCLSVHHHRHGLSGRYSRLLRQRSISIGQFVIPLEPPLMEAWTADADVTHCMVCRIEKFSMFNRRHHCRRCGRVICRACSRHRRHVKGYGAILVRICDECHELMESGRSDERHHDVERLRSSLSGNGGGGGAAASIPASRVAAPASTGSSLTNSTTTLVSGWRMSSTSEEENESIRAQFYYEQAPSSNLCISVLDLHSNLAVGASYLLKLCDDLSKLLLPIEPGLHNPELDYNLIISMMRTLLMSAKMKLAEAEEEDDGGGGARPELCDTYLSRVDLLQLLVAANCQDVPSLQQLTKPDSARRYRDKLLEDERFQLAMEVSAKCSLDMNAVWTNWGMTHLRARDYANARSKLSKCLKKPIDMNQSSPQLVQDIVSALQTADSIPDLLSSATISCNDLIADPTQMGVGSNVDAYDESLYYLRAYGTHLSLLTFYVSHGHVHEALQCLLVHDCAVDVFIEGVLAPCTEKGQLPKLLQQMESLDASLQQWCRYLKAACRYLDQRHLLHTLYDLQMFMKDYVRAAMTGIRFYRTGGGVSYAQLHERLPHLLLAAQHLEMFLREQKGHRGSGGDNTKKRVPPDDDLRLWLSPNDVHSHLLQSSDDDHATDRGH
ncbi:PREDICTED: zinc finger FYVE domain-containing protein 26-like isoform X2 [Priapulus caudatus]|uniref:Zinc finger FYVE domain-containing protein 26-like isoform X2 n=1 Tax=Priapulus caudatus TaxID=37621 RepID=A0ABM1E4P4_PRICU|nr:PREDICTED: zinc finger FYVE domain-containing protein 26-like isoform X2 [Priapulus caudatus]